jgi:hypothetical protein
LYAGLKARGWPDGCCPAPRNLQPYEQAQLDALADHVTTFAETITDRRGSRKLEGWLVRVELSTSWFPLT